VRDTISGSAEHRVDVRFHFAPGSNLDIQCFGDGQWVEEKAFVSHCYGQKEPSKALSFTAASKGSTEIISFLLPQNPGTDWQVREIGAQEGRAFEVCGAKTVDLVIIPAAGAWIWTRTIEGGCKETISICAALTG
jgi:hypothetical protein